MVYLLLSSLGSIIIPFVIRLSKDKAESNYGLYFCNYFMCLCLALLFNGEFKPLSYGKDMTPVLIIGAFTGLFYLLSLYYFDLCIQKSGIVITTIFKKTQLIVPILISIVVFNHSIKINQFIGIALSILSIIIMNYQKGSLTKIDNLGVLLIAVITGGMSDSFKDIFNEVCNTSLSNYFVIFLFAFALLSTAIAMIFIKSKISKYEILYGFALGIPNYLSAQAMTMALAHVNPVIAFPIYYMLTMIGTALVGILFFKEKIDLKKAIAMIIVIIAMIIING